MPSPGCSSNLRCEPLTQGVFPGHELFHFQFAPILFPPIPQLLPSPRRECPSPQPWGGDSPHPGPGRAAPPPWEGLCTLSHPLPLRPGAIFESAPRTEKGWGRGWGRAGLPACSALHPSTQGRDKEKADPPSNNWADICLAHTHPGSAFRKKIPVPLPWPPKPGTPGQKSLRMLTESATPFPTNPGLTAGEQMASQNSPRTQRPIPTRAYPCPHPSFLTSW